MMSPRKTILCLVTVTVLAVLTQAATVDLTHNNNNDNNNNKDLRLVEPGSSERARRQTTGLALRFQEMMNYMASLFRPGSPAYTLLQKLRSPSSYPASSASSSSNNRTPFRREPQALAQRQKSPSQQQVVRSSTATKCDPPCRTGSECCLRMPGDSVASCQSNRLSGSSCGWNHYSSTSPSTRVAIQRSVCPCMVGMACLSATASKSGTCTFF